MLTHDDEQTLLALARATLAAHLEERDLPELRDPGEGLRRRAGAFVTLHREEDLRGCIGHVTPRSILWRDVRSLAVSAATRDPRFPPVEPEELDDLRVEISVLGSPEPVEAREVEVGRHGLCVRNGEDSGLLLPQVATRNDWSEAEFLAYTCRKAGLEVDAWKDPETRIFAFEGISFAEEDGE